MSKFLYNNRLFVNIAIGIFIAQGLMAILQHHYVAGIVLIFLTLLPAIFLLLQIKKMYGSIFNKETFLFVLNTTIMVFVYITLNSLVMMLFP